MSQVVRIPGLPEAGSQALDELDGGLAISPVEIGERLWRVFTSMRTALVLILCLAALALAGTLLVQAPSGLSTDPQAYAAWLASIRPKYGGWTGLMDGLQLFAIFSSVWFKAIIVALTTSVLACSVNRFRGLWKTAVHPRMTMTMAFYERAPHQASVTTGHDVETALGAVQKAFGARRYRMVVQPDGEAIHVYADRFRWAPFGTLIAHISLVLILVGALIGSSFGFRNSEFAVAVGSRADVGNGTGLSVEATRFSDSYYANGSPSDYASDLILYSDGKEVAAQTIRVNQPLSYDGVTFYQSFFGAAAAMKVSDPGGTVLFDQGVPLEWSSSDGKRRVGQIDLPAAGLTAYVVGAASGEIDSQIKAGQMQIEVYKTGSEAAAVDTQIVSQGQPATVAGLQFTFVRERQFTGLIVARDPGALLVWLGAVLLVSGISLVFLFQNRRIWVLIRRRPDGSEIHLGATARHDATLRPEFNRLVEDMKLGLTRPSRA